jgi:prepilin-type N-terminal cleavage/methylation domain-containing protein
MQRNQKGFTLIEITIVLVLMAIISAYVIGRSMNTQQIDLAAQTDRIRNQIRYAQSMAMKRSDADEIWGIKLNTTTDQYWLFFATIPVAAGAPDLPAQQVVFPGEKNKKIALADLGVSMTKAPPLNSEIFFDRLGKPYTGYIDTTNNTALANDLTLTISSGGQNRTITIIPETGLVQ